MKHKVIAVSNYGDSLVDDIEILNMSLNKEAAEEVAMILNVKARSDNPLYFYKAVPLCYDLHKYNFS